MANGFAVGRKVVLDVESFKALSSETRISLLKLLDGSRMTLSDLARKMDLAKATVSSHLESLVNAGLATRIDEGRKWIYYTLTRKGKAIVHPETTKIYVVLALAVTSLAVGFISLLFWAAGPIFGESAVVSQELESPALYVGTGAVILAILLFSILLLMRTGAYRTVHTFG